jgi:hypothetical protein
MPNDQSKPDHQKNPDFLFGEISKEIELMSKAMERLDANISNDRNKIAEWKSSVDERVTLVWKCTKDLKSDGKELQNWKNDIDSRIKAQENWKAQHIQIEDWKKDKENRMIILETWKASQSGAQNLIKYAGTGVVSALLTFLLTYFILNRPAP